MALDDKDDPRQPPPPPEPEAVLGPVPDHVLDALSEVHTALEKLTWRQADCVLNAVRELIAPRRPKGESTW